MSRVPSVAGTKCRGYQVSSTKCLRVQSAAGTKSRKYKFMWEQSVLDTFEVTSLQQILIISLLPQSFMEFFLIYEGYVPDALPRAISETLIAGSDSDIIITKQLIKTGEELIKRLTM